MDNKIGLIHLKVASEARQAIKIIIDRINYALVLLKLTLGGSPSPYNFCITMDVMSDVIMAFWIIIIGMKIYYDQILSITCQHVKILIMI